MNYCGFGRGRRDDSAAEKNDMSETPNQWANPSASATAAGWNLAPEEQPHAGALTSRRRFLNACACRAVDYPPVWLMRQAGRVLPEYRALKEKHTFLELVRTPELATEVTLQPIRRFGFDAAILFSDILVVPEALGQSYDFREGGGVQMEFTLESAADIRRLEPKAVFDKLRYASEALRLVRRELGDSTALIGFAGSPWTLANFMLEGGSAKEFSRAKALFYESPELFGLLMEKLTAAVAGFLEMQIEAGADAVQIFDSVGGLLAANCFERASGMWMARIIEALEGKAPVLVFAKGVHGNWEELIKTGAQVLGVDWGVRLSDARARAPDGIGIQGNLDPALLKTTPATVRAEVQSLLDEMAGRPGYIFNLGHGVPPTAKLENIEALIQTIRQTS
jgi:uroporphyrinogen decarboxylase